MGTNWNRAQNEEGDSDLLDIVWPRNWLGNTAECVRATQKWFVLIKCLLRFRWTTHSLSLIDKRKAGSNITGARSSVQDSP